MRNTYSCVRGYRSFFNTVVEQLSCLREPTNNVDCYRLTVLSSRRVVGHLPKKISDLYLVPQKQLLYNMYSSWQSQIISSFGLEIPCTLVSRQKRSNDIIMCSKKPDIIASII